MYDVLSTRVRDCYSFVVKYIKTTELDDPECFSKLSVDAARFWPGRPDLTMFSRGLLITTSQPPGSVVVDLFFFFL